MDYFNKYIKYKTKYLNFKFGGNKNTIIHVSGPSGSGKTTLGNRLEKMFGDRLVVKDIDDLRQEFIKQFYGDKKWTTIDKEGYQKYIDDFVNRQTKPIIFVGLNNMFWWHKNHYYNMHPKRKISSFYSFLFLV